MLDENSNINQFKKQKPFRVPENYFESFAQKMQNTISEPKELNWFQKIFSVSILKIAIPSFLVFALCFSIYMINNNQLNTELSIQDITNYILEEEDFAIQDDFEELLAMNLNLDQPSLSEDEIIDYLLEEEIELELITQ